MRHATQVVITFYIEKLKTKMPNPRAFLGGFQIFKNLQLAPGCIVTKIKIEHIVVKQYREYTFPLTIEITGDLPSAEILHLFKTHVNGHKVINSQYGNPYDCYISDFEIKLAPQQPLMNSTKRNYIIKCMGYGKRVFE
mgnify:CR=1 FL=1